MKKNIAVRVGAMLMVASAAVAGVAVAADGSGNDAFPSATWLCC